MQIYPIFCLQAPVNPSKIHAYCNAIHKELCFEALACRLSLYPLQRTICFVITGGIPFNADFLTGLSSTDSRLNRSNLLFLHFFTDNMPSNFGTVLLPIGSIQYPVAYYRKMLLINSLKYLKDLLIRTCDPLLR